MAAAGLVALEEGRDAPGRGPRARAASGRGVWPRSPPVRSISAQVETNMVFVDTEAMGLSTALESIERLAALGVGAVLGPGRVPHGHPRRRGRRRASRWRSTPGAPSSPAREGAVMGLFSKNYPPEVAARVPPGNRLVKTWPVLHYGPIPTFDGTNWDLEVIGPRRGPLHADLPGAAGRSRPSTVDADMHCVTGWTTLDNTWEGVPFRTLLERARADARGEVGDRALRLRLHVEPVARRRWTTTTCWSPGATTARTSRPEHGWPAPPGRPEALRVEEREVADRSGVQREEHAAGSGRFGATTSTPSRSPRSATLPGRAAGRAGALAVSGDEQRDRVAVAHGGAGSRRLADHGGLGRVRGSRRS